MSTIFAFIIQMFSFFQPSLPPPSITPFPTPSSFPTVTPSPFPTATRVPTRKPTPVAQNSLLTAVNTFRTTHKNSSLIQSSILCKIAQERVHFLSKKGSLDNHEGYVGYKETLSKSFHQWWETIFFGSKPETPRDVVFNFWANSPGHRQSLLSTATHGCGAQLNGFAVFELGAK